MLTEKFDAFFAEEFPDLKCPECQFEIKKIFFAAAFEVLQCLAEDRASMALTILNIIKEVHRFAAEVMTHERGPHGDPDDPDDVEHSPRIKH